MTNTERAVFKIFIRGRIEDVWREITKTNEPQNCFFGNVLHTPGLAPREPIQMRTRSGKYAGVVGDVLEFDPPRLFAHTFRFTHLDDPPCVVRYELKATGDGVDFTLIVDEMPSGTKTARQMTQGGPLIVKALKSIVETGRPHFAMRMILRVGRLIEPFTPKKCRVENWPLERTTSAT